MNIFKSLILPFLIYYCQSIVVFGSDVKLPSETLAATQIDTTKAICRDINVYLDESGHIMINPQDVDGGSFASCGIDSMTLNQFKFECSQIGPNDVVFSIIDSCSNVDTCHALITVLDTIKPVVNCVDTFYLPQDFTGRLSLQDVNLGSYDNCGSFSTNFYYLDCFLPNVSNINFEIFDPSGNSSSCTVTVINSKVVIDSINTIDPLDCMLNDGEITIFTSHPSQVEYTISPDYLWQSSSDFAALDSGLYFVAVREIGYVCPTFAQIQLNCSPFAGMYLQNSKISGPNVVCEGDQFRYSLGDSIPGISLKEWYFNGHGISSVISNQQGYADLLIDFGHTPGLNIVLADLTDNITIFRDTLPIYVLDSTSCASYRCQQTVNIGALEMDNNMVPSYVEMQNHIFSTGHVDPLDEFHFQAGDFIELLPEFSVEFGGIFTIEIAPCTTPEAKWRQIPQPTNSGFKIRSRNHFD